MSLTVSFTNALSTLQPEIGPGGAGGKPSARGAGGLGFDSRRLPSLGLSAPPASTRSGDGLPRSRSLEEEEEKEFSCKWAPMTQ